MKKPTKPNKPRKSFSDQIRDAIRNCGTTRYALAQQVGVSGAILSRFLAGKQGMNLDTLDKLAGALGLEVISTIESVKRPKPKGRKPAKEKSMVAPAKVTRKKQRMINLIEAYEFMKGAEAFAKDAHENHFPSRRGIWHLEDCNKLCLYNNNPYAGHPELRDKELATFRERLKQEGIAELGFGTYPPEGEKQPGYTFAMIIDAGIDRQQWVVDVWRDIVGESSRQLRG